MHLLVVGATGRTGQKVLEQALQRGHHVTAIVRKASIPQMQGLRIVVADPCNADELSPALSGKDAVVSCLGQRSGGNPWLVRDATIAMTKALQNTNVKRYIIVSGALLYPSRNPIVRLLKRVMAQKLSDARAAENVLSGSAANWTVARPPHLHEGDRKGYRMETGPRPSLTRGLQFRDLADCLVDLAEEDTFSRQIIGVASR